MTSETTQEEAKVRIEELRGAIIQIMLNWSNAKRAAEIAQEALEGK
jgi:hypothetical protein